MSEPEKFLTRWSRRKLDADEPVAPTADEATPQTPPSDHETARGADSKPPALEFDPATLPPLDSIGADTDIASFLKPGVPGELRLAALRRAWSSDPAIRDFKGLAENDWDFTVPNAQMGFGEIDPGLDLKKMLSDVFGETPRAEPPSAEAPTEQLPPQQQQLSSLVDRDALTSPEQPSSDSAPTEPVGIDSSSGDKMLQRDTNVAAQTDSSDAKEFPSKKRRPHGGALPQ